jgi:hypothetical protein
VEKPEEFVVAPWMVGKDGLERAVVILDKTRAPRGYWGFSSALFNTAIASNSFRHFAASSFLPVAS